jgi:hypothetical protein
MRRIAVVLGIVLVVAGAGVGGGAVWARAQRHPTAKGIDFSIRTAADPNFCIQSQGDGSFIIGACNSNHNQRFALTDNPDGTNTLVEPDGDCVDRGTGAIGVLLVSAPCTFGASRRFKYNTAGHFRSPGVSTCIADAKAAQDAAVFIAKCANPSVGTVFGLSQ